MTKDSLTVLTSKGPLLTKRWLADGTILGTDRAKMFSVEDVEFSGLAGLAEQLRRIAADPRKAVLRGAWIDDQPNADRSNTTRDLDHFREKPRYWVMFDIDGFIPVLADPLTNPGDSIVEFVETQLPKEFTGCSHFWQLSSSAGSPNKTDYLKAHLWFLWDRPIAGPVLEAWARFYKVPVDITTLRTCQIHYVSDPVIDEGANCPVLTRSGLFVGDRETVALLVPDDIESLEIEKTTSRAGMTDPSAKPGLIGAWCRVYPPARLVDEVLSEHFSWETDSDSPRLTWIGGNGAQGGAVVTDDGLHVFNSHSTDPFAGRAINSWDMTRHYLFGELDGDDPSVYEFAGPTALPSDRAMRDHARADPEVQAELMNAALGDPVSASAVKAPASLRGDEEEPQSSHSGDKNDDQSSHAAVQDAVQMTAPVALYAEPAPATITEPLEPSQLSKALAAVARCTDANDLETRLAANLRDAEWTDIERGQIVTALAERVRAMTGTRLPLATVRGWMTAPAGAAGWPDVTPQGRILGTEGNVKELLRSMGAVVRYDTMRKADEILLQDRGFTVDNRDNASLTAVLSAANAVDMKIQVATLKSMINMIAESNQYNPPLEWISSRPWDGVDRLQAWCDTVTTTPERTRVKEMLMRRWALQCVSILHNTGDDMARAVLTFTGKQYIGKSKWLQSLAPAGMVRTGHLLDVHNKDSIKIAVGYWITELGELDSTFRKSDLAALKAFISNTDDEQRLPYAPSASKFPRRTSFAATVNESDFLKDATGNSRYWAIEVSEINYAHGLDMQQVWAQVLAEWHAGDGSGSKAEHWLAEEEMTLLNESNEDFTVTDSLTELAQTRLAWDTPETGWLWCTATQIAEAIGASSDRSAVTRLGAIVRRLNGDKRRRLHGGVRVLLVPGSGDTRGDTDKAFGAST